MKKKYVVSLILLVVVAFLVWLFFRNNLQDKTTPAATNSSQDNRSNPVDNKTTVDNPVPLEDSSLNKFGFIDPLSRAAERITKKTLGQYITPQNSPVQPEKFQGYHTGTDFEIFPEEADAAVSVRAVCSGKLLLKEFASGYGGVAVESCDLEGNPITVIYGHLKLTSIDLKNGSDLKAGDVIGVLGKGYSSETDGERKHLHLGFCKGSSVNIRGYVSSVSQLSGWLDPCVYICGK